ncbi:MAG: diol dehydratase small subunit, partial [Terracidiphilus sp.]
AKGAGAGTPAAAGKLDAKKDYPLAIKRPDLVKSVTGLGLKEITLDKVVEGKLSFDDMKIHPDTLEYQAQIAISAGRPQIANNLRRAAELTKLPDTRVLEIYNALRPYHSTKQELLDIASELENKYQAKICAAFVREAVAIYEKRGRIKQ